MCTPDKSSKPESKEKIIEALLNWYKPSIFGDITIYPLGWFPIWRIGWEYPIAFERTNPKEYLTSEQLMTVELSKPVSNK